MVYFLHDGGLYNWTDLTDSVSKGTSSLLDLKLPPKFEKLRKICCTVSDQFNKLDEHTFFVLHNVHEQKESLDTDRPGRGFMIDLPDVQEE